ncbi:MAG: hypothetical protein ABSH20_22975 [Tepidisphaeraceae bacterium]
MSELLRLSITHTRCRAAETAMGLTVLKVTRVSCTDAFSGVRKAVVPKAGSCYS